MKKEDIRILIANAMIFVLKEIDKHETKKDMNDNNRHIDLIAIFDLIRNSEDFKIIKVHQSEEIRYD
jgi:hypothetical protein